MQTMRSHAPGVDAIVGYAADGRGSGVAYARLSLGRSRRLLRVGFRVGSAAPFPERAVGYAALTAVTRVLCRRGFREVRFALADADFVEEIASGRGVGETLVLPYVRLRCALNSLITFDVRTAPTDDLTQRARAEAALNVAA
ncbi:MAG: hypothetical protein WAL67_17100 [Candidatus Cybelea sp.]